MRKYYHTSIINGTIIAHSRCWSVFKKWHLLSGYSIWILCLLLYNSPRKYYYFTIGTLILENLIIAFGPWFFWLLDAPVKAGVTFISEYTIIITVRWAVVLILEFPLFSSILQLVVSIINRILNTLRRLGDSEQPRNADGTFSSTRLGRPKRN